MRGWLSQKGHRHQEICPQRLASSRLMPINMPGETTNRIAAHLNVGAGAGRNAGSATSVCTNNLNRLPCVSFVKHSAT